MKTKTLKITVSTDTVEVLRDLATLHGWSTAEEALAYLASCANDGARRPGSWERGWLEHAFPIHGFSGFGA